jgi:hypothetical protein
MRYQHLELYWEFLCLCSSKKWTYYSLFCCVLICFWYQANTDFIQWDGSIPSLLILWNSLRSIDVSSLKIWTNSAVNPSGLGLHWETIIYSISLFIIDSISLFIIDLLRILYQYPIGAILVGHMDLEIYPFLLDFPVY